MPHPDGKKEEGRARVLAGAARGFRRHGFGGLGVDGLAKEAGVTSGAFYAHFKSKAEAFRTIVIEGMQSLRAGIEQMRSSAGPAWRYNFIDFYLTERRSCDLAESCALQSLTPEVGRASRDVRASFEDELRRVIEVAADPDGGHDRAQRADAIAMLALLSGGVTMARAVNDPALADEIVAAVRCAAIATGKQR